MRSVVYASAILAFMIVHAAFLPLGYVSSISDGTFTVEIAGYSITGLLTNATIQADNTTSALISVDQTVGVPFGSAHVAGSGRLLGNLSGVTVQGTSDGFSGTAQVCFLLFFCQSSDFVGTGTWAGTVVNGTQASGTFQGTITFDKPLPHVPQQTQVTGTWNANFTA
jgi:hypothetical protein